MHFIPFCYVCDQQRFLLVLLIVGILVEGFSSLIASMVGTGTGLSSFRDNVSALSVTKVDMTFTKCIADIICCRESSC